MSAHINFEATKTDQPKRSSEGIGGGGGGDKNKTKKRRITKTVP